jgi:hypothetical protein
MRRAPETCSRRALLGPLLTLLLASGACGGSGDAPAHSREDTVQRSPDAGIALPSEDDPAEAEVSEDVLLRQDIEHLEALLAGELLPDGVEPRALFAVDLSDPEACANRVRSLRRVLGAEPPPAPEESDGGAQDGGVPSDGGAPGDGGLVTDGGDAVDAGPPDAGAASAPAPDGGVADAGVPDAGIDGGLPEPLVDDASREELRRRRDELRLAFLELPLDERASRLAAVEADRALFRRAEEARVTEEAAEVELRAAEAERAEASARAADASSLSVQAQQSRRAEIASIRAAAAEALAVAAASRRRDAEEERERVGRMHEIANALHGDLEPAVAEALYDELVQLLIATRRSLSEALAHRPEDLPTIGPDPDDDPETAAAVAAVRTRRAEAEQTLERLAWDHVEALARALHEGNDVRLELLALLPADRRASLLGLMSADGRQQLLREVQQLELMSRYGGRHLVRTAPGWPGAILDLAGESQSRRDLLGLIFLMMVLVVVYRRRLAIVDALEEWTAGKTESRRIKRVIFGWFARVRAAASPIVLLLGAAAAFPLLMDIREAPEVLLLRTLVLAFLTYRLFVRLLGHELTRGPVRRFGRRQVRVHVPTARSERIRVDVRRVGRFLLAVVAVLGAARWIVGKGTLYAQLVRLMVFAGVILLYVLLRRWREEIARRYAVGHPHGKLTDHIQDASGLKLDLFATIAALEMGAQRVVEGGRALLLRFTAGRRAMAMLSRRRLEKGKSEEEAPTDQGSAPERQVATAFPLGAVDPKDGLQRFPQLDAIATLAERVREGGRGAAVALVGEAGMGKTTWLRALAEKVGGDPKVLDAPPSAHDRSIFCRWLSEQLGLPMTDSPAGIAQALDDSELRGLICVDCGENLFLRRIGGTEGFRALAEIAGRTQERLVWVCAFSENGWRYLRAAEAGQNLFGRVVELRGWPEEEVAELVESRMRQAGLVLDFSGLLEGTAAEAALAGPARQRALERAREEYFRLLWDATDGNPRLVSHFWLRSLQRDEETRQLTVRLFDAPDPAVLDALHDESRFLLAAVVVHEDLSAGEAAMVLRWPVARCAALLDTLAARGILSEDADRPGRFRIHVHYFRAVLRHLRRRRLLPPG